MAATTERNIDGRIVYLIRELMPRNLIDMMANAFIDVNNGVLSAPLLRSYMEIHANIILENTINTMLKKFEVDRYSKKKDFVSTWHGVFGNHQITA
jgi:hypothetical protein